MFAGRIASRHSFTRCLAAGVALIIAGCAEKPVAPPSVPLVSPEEVALDARTRPPGPPPTAATRSISSANGPAIVVEEPDVARPLRSPLSFHLHFIPRPGMRIDPASFHATYGFLGLDITARLLERAHLTADALTADNVAIPPGNHSVTIRIGDQSGNVTSQTFQFSIP